MKRSQERSGLRSARRDNTAIRLGNPARGSLRLHSRLDPDNSRSKRLGRFIAFGRLVGISCSPRVWISCLKHVAPLFRRTYRERCVNKWLRRSAAGSNPTAVASLLGAKTFILVEE